MIIVSSPSKPFTYTAKVTARRQAIINDYETEIDALYSCVVEASQLETTVPDEWTSTKTANFVRKTVLQILRREVPNDANILQHGCDRFVSRNIFLSKLWIEFIIAYKRLGSAVQFCAHFGKLRHGLRRRLPQTSCTTIRLSRP
jgi:hypothetical protein